MSTPKYNPVKIKPSDIPDINEKRTAGFEREKAVFYNKILAIVEHGLLSGKSVFDQHDFEIASHYIWNGKRVNAFALSDAMVEAIEMLGANLNERGLVVSYSDLQVREFIGKPVSFAFIVRKKNKL